MNRYWLFAAVAALCAPGATTAEVFNVRGRVESVSPGEGRFVAAHEDIPGFMEAMVMPFEVDDPSELEGVAAGDLVAFELVVEENGARARNIEALPAGAQLDLPADRATHDRHGHNHAILRGPAGVMGEHTHEPGGIMFSYRWTRMQMDGMRDGTDDVSTHELFEQGYSIAPEEMTMDMHMLMGMYALTDRLTLMAMAHYMEIEMQSQMRMHAHMIHPMDMRSEGWADTTLSAIYKLADDENWNLVTGLGLSLPTGGTDEADREMHMENKHMAYPMQLGSGTYDLKPSVTWTQTAGDWCWGAQGNATIRLDDNADGYSLGDGIGGTAWLTRKLGFLAVSARVSAEWQDEISGEDKDLGNRAAMMNPAADPANSGGTIVEGHLGVQAYLPGRLPGDPWVAVEVGAPLYQDLNGPQMQRDYTLSATISTSF